MFALFTAGADSGGRGAHPKIGKNMIFWRKIVIFHTKYSNNFRASSDYHLGIFKTFLP
jgi:hypothetical protein